MEDKKTRYYLEKLETNLEAICSQLHEIQREMKGSSFNELQECISRNAIDWYLHSSDVRERLMSIRPNHDSSTFENEGQHSNLSIDAELETLTTELRMIFDLYEKGLSASETDGDKESRRIFYDGFVNAEKLFWMIGVEKKYVTKKRTNESTIYKNNRYFAV